MKIEVKKALNAAVDRNLFNVTEDILEKIYPDNVTMRTAIMYKLEWWIKTLVYSLVTIDSCDYLYVKELEVVHSGKGYGTYLFKILCDYCKKTEAVLIVYPPAISSNYGRRAINFYKQFLQQKEDEEDFIYFTNNEEKQNG